MALFGNLVLRLISISFAFVLAVIAAGMFIGFGFYNEVLTTGPLLDSWEEEMFAFVSLGIGFASTLLIGAYSIGLVAILIAIAELMRWKGLVTNLVLGGLSAGFLALTGFDNSRVISSPVGSSGEYGPLLVALSAGFIAGFVYWLIAGRRAGDWLGPANSVSSES